MARVTAALSVIALFAVFPSMEAAQHIVGDDHQGRNSGIEYIVGDDQGWNSGVDFYGWMDGKTFYAGDILVFNYTPGDHNVVAANYDVYDKCATTPNLGIGTSGSDYLELPTAGTYYFLCEFHCDYTEQRIMVVVNS